MDVYGKLQLKWSVGYDGSPLHFIDNSTLVYATGNGLCFVHHTGRHVRSLPSHGSGVGPIAAAPQASTIVYAESTLNPKVFAISYPTCQLTATLRDGAKLEYVSLAISNSGKRLASLSGVSDFLLIIWDVVEGCQLCRTSVGPGGHQLSLNPLNWRQMCVIGAERLTLYLLEQCNNDQLMLTAQETTLPETSTKVGTTLHPPKLSLSVTQVQSKADEMEPKHATTDHPTLPDLSTVLYKETYDEYTRERNCVVLTSHCWSSQQTLYVGCRGGQLVTVDFDTGAIQVLANTQITQLHGSACPKDEKEERATATSRGGREEGRGKGEGGGPPNTAHAVLAEGSLECLALSKRGLFAAGKDGGLVCFALSTELQVLESYTLPSGDSISCLSWSPDYARMAIGTQQAAIHIADPLHLLTCSLLSAHGCSPIVGLDMLTPGSEHVVTCRADGTLQVWNVEDASLVSSYRLEQEVCCVSCPISCRVAVVGYASGHVCAVSLTQPASPTLLAQTRLYHSPVTAIKSDQRGRFLAIAASSDRSIFLCSAFMSRGFVVLGHTGVKGDVLDLSLVTIEPGNEGSTLIAVLSKHTEKTLLTLFHLPNSIVETTPPDLYSGDAKEFSSDFIWKQEAVLTEPVSKFVLASPSTAFAALRGGIEIVKFSLPSLQQKLDVDVELSADVIFPAHDMDRVYLGLSFHQKWLASAASDGKVVVRLVENPEKSVMCTPHHYQKNGCTAIVLSRDCQHIITVGDKGAVTCWNWDFTNHGSLKSQAAREYLERVMHSLRSQYDRENSALEAMSRISDQTTLEGERTWLEVAEEEVHRAEDEEYSDLKLELRREISELREKLLGMISANEQAPDMERLSREEFILDMEEHDRLQAEENELIQQVREEIELSSLAKMFLREQIKSECWNSMAVKGKVIKGFHGSLEVSNYPMINRSEVELKELARVCTLRAIELADRKVHSEATSSLPNAALAENEVDVLGEEEGGDGDTPTAAEGEEGDASALYGSHGPKFGGGCDLLYSQFELHSPVAKKHQIVLLQDCLYRIAETFNKEFEEVARLKLAEIARIREKNMRILKIIHQLQLEEELVQPSLCPDEQPEEMLTVQDCEVQVEKYLSPEEQQRQEEARRLEEEKRLAEMGDNPRERALDMMMGGRLEANVEEDLFKDLPRPDFMLKDPTERTEDEIRAALEFEKKELAFLEEREKMKKALEGELRKLQSGISQAMENFDDRLRKLFDLKINTEMTIHQEQLKIVGLVSSLQVEEEVTGREKQLNTLLRNKKALKAQLSSVINTAKQKVRDFREQYDQMLAEDKALDRNFKRDFSDCEPFVDQLYKLFKRRPRGQKLKQGTSEGNLTLDPKSQNPFPIRPPSAVGGGQKLAAHGSEDGMSDLDHMSHMPDGVDTSQWDRLIAARRRKWDSEMKVKTIALQLAEMEAFLKRRLVEEERLQTEIQDSFSELNRLSEDKTQFNLDLTVQLLLKQGQVEIDEGDFIPDYSESVLVHRRIIEELNKEIKTHGEGKLASMNECKDFKRGIRMLEWECSKLQMQVEDLREQAREVQLLRVTKDLQLNLNEGSCGNRDHHEIETLEKTLEINERTHQKKVQEKKQQLAKLQMQGERRRQENRALDHTLMDKQVSVLERQAAEKLAGVAPSEAGARQRMVDIVSRRRLVELARAQAAEIGVLRAELERLRMATFPALVQVD